MINKSSSSLKLDTGLADLTVNQLISNVFHTFTTVNKSRELFLLFKPADLITTWLSLDKRETVSKSGYTLIHCHTFPNDEPPYIMVKYWGINTTYDLCKPIDPEDGEIITCYLIRTQDVKKFIALMNESQDEYCDYYNEGIMTRNAGEHNLSPAEYADQGISHNSVRQPKIKRIYGYPNTIQLPTM